MNKKHYFRSLSGYLRYPDLRAIIVALCLHLRIGTCAVPYLPGVIFFLSSRPRLAIKVMPVYVRLGGGWILPPPPLCAAAARGIKAALGCLVLLRCFRAAQAA